MGKYLKSFDTHNGYSSYQSGSDFLSPNVSICLDDDSHVHYKWKAPDDVIIYTTNDGNVVTPNYIFGIVSNTYKNGKGIIKYGSPVTSIETNTFYNCQKLESVEIPDSVTSIGNNAFYYCSALKSVNIPSGVTSIGGYAFYYCSALKSVNIPSGVTSIGGYAFSGCSGLTSVTCLAAIPPTLGSSVFSSISSNYVIYVPAGSVDTYKAATNWSSYASKIQAIP